MPTHSSGPEPQQQSRRSLGARLLVGVMLAIAVGLASPSTAVASIRTEIPTESPGPPFYLRVVNDDELAALIFYRDPACVPSDYNLFLGYDIPRAFGCPLTVEGFEVWKNGPPPVDQSPIHVKLRGTGSVAVWFVSVSDLESGMVDGVLTLDEIAALPSLQTGTATSYHETLHPEGAPPRAMIEISAKGVLSGGGRFRIHAAMSQRAPAPNQTPELCECPWSGKVQIELS